MPRYALNIIQPVGPVPPPEVLEPIMRATGAFLEETKASNVWVFNGGLTQPSAATVVRASGADVSYTDGPYLESKEFIGGVVIIEVADLDAALDWGGRLARATTLPIEVRAFAWSA